MISDDQYWSFLHTIMLRTLKYWQYVYIDCPDAPLCIVFKNSLTLMKSAVTISWRKGIRKFPRDHLPPNYHNLFPDHLKINIWYTSDNNESNNFVLTFLWIGKNGKNGKNIWQGNSTYNVPRLNDFHYYCRLEEITDRSVHSDDKRVHFKVILRLLFCLWTPAFYYVTPRRVFFSSNLSKFRINRSFIPIYYRRLSEFQL